jgi:hypothetical protein
VPISGSQQCCLLCPELFGQSRRKIRPLSEKILAPVIFPF